MKNVNGARFQLLLGRADWGRCIDGDAAGAQSLAAWWAGTGSPALPPTLPAWDAARDELTLQPRAIALPATATEAPFTLEARRGAAADRYGNVYRVADDRRSLHVASAGSGNDSAFWPAEPSDCSAQRAQARLAFDVCVPGAAATPDTYLAMAVTCDDWLVVAFARGVQRGLLSFDLVAGGQPLETLWPDAIAFAPFDMCARERGGVWILDREHRKLWELDGSLAVVRSGQPLVPLVPAVVDDFQPLVGAPRTHAAVDFPDGLDLAASPGWVIDPIAVEPGVGDGVLLLDRDDAQQRSRVARLRRVGDDWVHDASDWLVGLPAQAHDFVHAAAPRWPCAADGAPAKQLFVATTVGNQVRAFGVVDDGTGFALYALPLLFPLRRWGGRALIAVRGDGRYDSGPVLPIWTLFVQQPRARFEATAELVTPVFDSGELGTTWDKLLIDAAIPAGTTVEVWSRAADERERFDAAPASPAEPAQLVGGWMAEPALLLRPDGAELPWLRREAVRATRRDAGQGTWELLLQAAVGRYVQLKLRLASEQGTTPRLRALRVWAPRFSYPQRFLPAVYREDESGAHFLERWLANFESTLTGIEDKVAGAQALFDARSAPAEALGWLAEWFDLALDPGWDERRHRLFVRHAMDFFRWRGTVRGLRIALELAFDPCFDAAMFDGPRDADEGARRIRIVETYTTRLVGALAAGDPGTAALQGDSLQRVATHARWTPAEGNAGLVDRYAASQQRKAAPSEQLAPFPLLPPEGATAAAAAEWAAFCRSVFGFEPAVGAQERARWQAWLLARHGSREQVNAKHGTAYARIDQVSLPTDAPSNANAAADWKAFCERADGAWTRARWQDFLARRYRRIERLNSAHGTRWSGFELVALPDRLPASRAAQTDWLQFEGQLLAMHRSAHRFSVLLPVASVSADPYELEERLGLARRIVELEKPAHTVFDVRFFWAFNRVGEARLGLDTQIGAGSRASELIPDAVVGRAYVGASFVAGPPRPTAPDRRLLAC